MLGYVLLFIEHLTCLGLRFGGNAHTDRHVYVSSFCGISVLFLQNTLSRYDFAFMRRYLHFADNDLAKPVGEPGHDPLHKVQNVMNVLHRGLRNAWICGENVTKDESIIKYMG